MKSVNSNEATDTIIQQAENPTQWFQLLNVLDQPDLPGWPLLVPQKVQMQKCKKCSREFCAPINYRRHVRMHRRSLNVDKDSHKIRDMLAAFWDMLSPEKAKEVVSFNNVTLKKPFADEFNHYVNALQEVSGSSVIKAWQTSISKPVVWTLPQDYMRSGSTLLDVIDTKLPISSQELFYILDDASEKTFLCAGTAESVQNYVFDGDVMKIALELRNMVACISFLFERKLVKAWLSDKDAEALRCQKLLVEEEEAARKRRAALSKRKKERKIRQKEQKEKEHSFLVEKSVLDITINSMEQSLIVVTQSTPSGSNSSDSPDMSPPADVISIGLPIHSLKNENYIYDSGVEMLDSSPMEESSNVRRRWRVPKSQRKRRNGFLEGQQNDQLVQQVEPSSQKVWTKKYRNENNEVQPEENNRELIIGSISVSLPIRNQIIWKKDVGLRSEQKKSEDIKQILNSQNVQATGSRKQWRPLNCGYEAEAQLPIIQNVNRESEKAKVIERVQNVGFNGSSQENDSKINSLKEKKNRDVLSLFSDVTALTIGGGVMDFSSVAARAYLSERWKNAVSADHVNLVLSP